MADSEGWIPALQAERDALKAEVEHERNYILSLRVQIEDLKREREADRANVAVICKALSVDGFSHEMLANWVQGKDAQVEALREALERAERERDNWFRVARDCADAESSAARRARLAEERMARMEAVVEAAKKYREDERYDRMWLGDTRRKLDVALAALDQTPAQEEATPAESPRTADPTPHHVPRSAHSDEPT